MTKKITCDNCEIFEDASINFNEVTKVELRNEFAFIHFQNNTFRVIDISSTNCTSKLPSDYFFNISDNIYINLFYVYNFIKGKDVMVFMEDGSHIIMSDEKYETFIRAINRLSSQMWKCH